MKPKRFSTPLAGASVIVVLWLGSVVGCAKPAPPDFSILRAPPILSEEAEEQAAQADGSPLAEFAWSCDAYGAYIDKLRDDSE